MRRCVTSDLDLHAAALRYQYSNSEKLRIRADTHRVYSERPDRLRDEVLAHLALTPGLVVLDVGCGPGGYHASIRCAGASVVGVDQSAAMVREASGGHLGSLAQPDAQALPFGDTRFDRLLAAHMLYHFPDRQL